MVVLSRDKYVAAGREDENCPCCETTFDKIFRHISLEFTG
jgi:hypothetical protein